MTNEADGIVAAWRERVDRGEAQKPEELIRAHPEIAEELRARFAVVQMLEGRAAPEAPSSLGEYRLLREIGRGGMGVVYEAEQTSMRRKVALKVLFPSVTSTPDAVKRFCREAWAAGRVKHTNIVAVHQLGQERGTWYCAMELVEGRPLNRVIEELRSERKSLRESRLARHARGVPTPSPLLAETATGTRAYYLRVAEMFAEVAEALQLAHDHRILHRDVKPSNLLLDAEGRLKLVDFGLARLQDGSTAVTRTGDVVGTPLYMSPEQVTGRRDLDGRTDVYSLGATLYETLTLRAPFRAGTVAALAAEVIRSDPPAPRRIDAQVPRDLETIVLKALEKEPTRRYRTAGDMARDLRAFVHGGVVRARRVGPVGRLARRVRRNKLRAALAAIALLAAGTAAFYAIGQARERDRRTDLEYERLCLKADQALARGTSWHATGENGMATADVATGPSAVEILESAIRLRPGRSDAYFLRAIAPGRTREERLADLDAAGARGLAERSWRLAKADVLADAGRTGDADAEERLAANARPSDASTLLAEGLIAKRRGDRKAALDRMSETLAYVDAPTSVRCRALWWRSGLLEEAGDLDGAVADLHALQLWTGDRIIVAVKIASLRRRLGRKAEAEALLAEALKRAADSGDEDTWLAISRQCRDSREYAWLERVTASGLALHARSARLHAALAAALLCLGKTEEALVASERAIQLDPALARAHRSRGATLFALHRPAEALAAFDRAIELDPNNAEAHNNRGNVLASLGRVDEAFAAFNRALEFDSKYSPAHCSRGMLLATLGRFEEALPLVDRAIELDPTYARAHACRGWVLANLRRPEEEALAALDRAIELDPNNAYAHANRARLLYKLRRPEDALAALDLAIELDPRDSAAHDNRGAVLHNALHRPAEALAAFDRAIELDPNNPATHRNRGRALLTLGRLDEALAAYSRAIELNPRDSAAYNDRGGVLGTLGRHEEALADFDQAVNLDPGNAMLHCNRGVCLRRLHRLQEALAACDRAIEIDPKSIAHSLRGDVLRDLGRISEALAALDRAVEVDPSNLAAHMSRGALLCDYLLRPVEALAAFDRAVELQPAYGATHFNRGNVLLKLDRLDEALAAYDRALQLNPNDATSHQNRGVALQKLGRFEQALQALERATELAPSASRLNQVAWLLAAHPDPAFRDAAKAAQFATGAVELAPDEGSYWNTLGVALCRAERWKDALEALDKSMSRRDDGDAYDWFFAAIAKWHLGNRNEARALYDKAAAWADEHAPQDEDLRRFRDEAAKLLGVKP